MPAIAMPPADAASFRYFSLTGAASRAISSRRRLFSFLRFRLSPCCYAAADALRYAVDAFRC